MEGVRINSMSFGSVKNCYLDMVEVVREGYRLEGIAPSHDRWIGSLTKHMQNIFC